MRMISHIVVRDNEIGRQVLYCAIDSCGVFVVHAAAELTFPWTCSFRQLVQPRAQRIIDRNNYARPLPFLRPYWAIKKQNVGGRLERNYKHNPPSIRPSSQNFSHASLVKSVRQWAHLAFGATGKLCQYIHDQDDVNLYNDLNSISDSILAQVATMIRITWRFSSASLNWGK